MSKAPPDHLVHLRRHPFAFRCSTSVFPPDEFAALSEYGNWMEALVSGAIQPVTPAQVHFLRAAREEDSPSTVYERSWVRLQGRREYERALSVASPPSPSEDYGMVEWDGDRWW